MSNFTEKAFSIDFEKLYQSLDEKRDVPEESGGRPQVRTTVFSLGTDPRIATRKVAGTPEITLVENLKDGLDNPYIKINWKVSREDVDRNIVKGFSVFRRKLSEIEREALGASTKYDEYGFERLARKNKKVGKFSEDRKAIYNVRRGALPMSILNPNLSSIESKRQEKTFDDTTSEDYPGAAESSFERFEDDKDFVRIAYLDYKTYMFDRKAQFEGGRTVRSGNEVLRFDSGGVNAQVIDRDFVTLSFVDKKVGFEEGFEYYVASITSEIGEPIRSNSITLLVRQTVDVRPAVRVIAKQINETSIQLSIMCDPRDNIDSAIIHKRSEDQIIFFELIEARNKSDCIQIVDEDVSFAKTYTYRVFLKSIHGGVSQPTEITIYSSAQRISPASRSNNLKIPIISAVQDQGSEFIRVNIFPNDPNVAYYELKRRDLTIHERRFAVPSKGETNYGASGWTTNKFFVDKEHEVVADGTSLKFEEISFIDDTVSRDHIYQYQVRGYDLFGNFTSYALSLVRVEGKKSLRSPINVRSQLIRGFPFRVKIAWDDDNEVATSTTEDAFSDPELSGSSEKVKIAYLVQRRKLGETVYESFPLTANNFIIDETVSPDPVKFSVRKITDQFSGTMVNMNPEQFDIDVADDIRRSFKLPNFLFENDVYFYRVAAQSPDGERSNFSREFQIQTLSDLSDPVNFKADVPNTLVSPIIVILSWELEGLKSRPDHWVVERKIDTPNEDFSFLGRAYLETEFVDSTTKPGNQYIYRIKSVDIIGRQSSFFEARISI